MTAPSPLEQAAIDYVAARAANDAAEPSGWVEARIRLDASWCALCCSVETFDAEVAS